MALFAINKGVEPWWLGLSQHQIQQGDDLQMAFTGSNVQGCHPSWWLDL